MTSSASVVKPVGFVVLASTEKFLRFGFWRPGMQRVHAKVWDTLHEMGVRFWSDASREILVHPEDLAKANAVLLNVEHQFVPQPA